MIGFNFTENSRKVLAGARLESSRLGHEYVGTEHILLSLTRTAGTTANVVLHDLGVDAEKMAETIETTIKTNSPAPAPEDLPYTSRAKKVLELSMVEARDLRHSYVGTEHLVLGLLREEKGLGAQVLRYHGVTTERAREAMRRIHGSAAEPESEDVISP